MGVWSSYFSVILVLNASGVCGLPVVSIILPMCILPGVSIILPVCGYFCASCLSVVVFFRSRARILIVE